MNNVPEEQFNRPEAFEKRRSQQISFHAFPTTSIGSFPQTAGDPSFAAIAATCAPVRRSTCCNLLLYFFMNCSFKYI